MPNPRNTFALIVFILTFSIFLANLLYYISVVEDENLSDGNELVGRMGTQGQTSGSSSQPHGLGIVGESPNHLIWFLQVSDLHISIFHDLSRINELQEFCDLTVSAINPAVVLASGDLTDAKTRDNMGSRQFEQEWQLYKNVLDLCKVTSKTTWLDTRGNHDNFNVPGRDSKENYYRTYTMQGKDHPKSYMYQKKHGGEMYSFIALDACLEPGPRRPFNFVGVVTHNEADNIAQLVKESRRNGGNYTIWFGHYPTSCILAPGKGGIRDIIGEHPEALVYVCGHFHMLGGLVPKMYTRQKAGFLELELADWKDNRMYRLLAVDHGLLSFVDIHHRSWPVVLVTNPKHALFVMPTREPVNKIAQSTHIRLLAFSLSPISIVKIRINHEDWTYAKHIKGPLYTVAWDSVHYITGLHDIQVYVKDKDGREITITQPFSLDGTRLAFSLLPRLALMCNVSMLFQFMYGIMLVLCILPLCVLKCVHKLVKDNIINKPKFTKTYSRSWLRKMWILSTVDRIFFPLVLYPLYLTFGPWSIGEIIEGHTGIIFAWGTLIKGQYLPGSFTYLYGFTHLCIFQFPVTLMMAENLENRYDIQILQLHFTVCRQWLRNLPFLGVLVLQLLLSYSFWLAYGTMAFILSPLRTWSAIFAAFLWYLLTFLPDKSFSDASSVWKPTDLEEFYDDHYDDMIVYRTPNENNDE